MDSDKITFQFQIKYKTLNDIYNGFRSIIC